MLFSLPRTLSPDILLAPVLTSFRSLLRCHLLSKALPDHPIVNENLVTPSAPEFPPLPLSFSIALFTRLMSTLSLLFSSISSHDKFQMHKDFCLFCSVIYLALE